MNSLYSLSADVATYCALTKIPLPISQQRDGFVLLRDDVGIVPYKSNYLDSLIAACGAIRKRGKLVCVTVKVDIALYVFGIKSVAAHYTLIAVTLW